MKKPKYQIIYDTCKWILLGIFFAGNVLDALGNTFNLMTFSFAVSTTISLSTIYVFLLFMLRNRKIKWTTKNQQQVTIKEFGKKTYGALVGVLFLIWLPVLVKYFINETTPANMQKANFPCFSKIDPKFKVLIIPFDEETEFEKSMVDVGKIIFKRLSFLNVTDSLNLSLCYLTDSIDFRKFTSKTADSVMRYHYADQVIYGSYLIAGCGSTSEKAFCFNYLTDTAKIWFRYKNYNIDYKMIDVPSINAIRDGMGQEDIDFIVYYFASYSAFIKRDFTRTLKLIEKIKDFNNYEALAIVAARCYEHKNELNTAEGILKKVIKQNPNSLLGWSGLGIVKTKQGLLLEARKAYEKALSISDHHDIHWANFANVLVKLADTTKARICFEQAISRNPNNALTLYSYGGFNISQGNLDEAKKHLEKASKLTPFNYGIWHALSIIHIKRENFAESLRCSEMAYSLNPNDSGVVLNLAVSLYGLNRNTEAIKYLEREIARGQTDSSTLLLLGQCFLRTNELSKGLSIWEKVIEMYPTHEEALTNIGFAYLNLRNFNAAEKYFKITLRFHPKSHFTYYNLATLNGHLGQKICLRYLKTAIQINSLYKSQALNNPEFAWLKNDSEFIHLTR